MRKIILISCGSKKLPRTSKARDLYTSSLFKKNLEYAQSLNSDQVFILSAKHGLVGLDDSIEPYDKTLNQMPMSAVRSWASTVLGQLSNISDLENDHFVFLAGQKYRHYIVPHIRHVDIPFEGLRIGEQLQQLTYLIEESKK